VLQAYGEAVPCVNAVRNEINKLRKTSLLSDVVLTTPNDNTAPKPYFPRRFPLGTWNVTKCVEGPKDSYVGPIYFDTDAWQMVEEWALDEHGFYTAPTGRFVRDSGYGAHHASVYDPKTSRWVDSYTTLGCLNLWYNHPDWLTGISWLRDKFKSDTNKVILEVEE
jgi:hypothetical protein